MAVPGPASERRRLPLLLDMFCCGVGPAMATVFTNPLEVTKTRLQFSGEKGTSRLYSSPLDCIRATYRAEGLRGVQVRLPCARPCASAGTNPELRRTKGQRSQAMAPEILTRFASPGCRPRAGGARTSGGAGGLQDVLQARCSRRLAAPHEHAGVAPSIPRPLRRAGMASTRLFSPDFTHRRVARHRPMCGYLRGPRRGASRRWSAIR